MARNRITTLQLDEDTDPDEIISRARKGMKYIGEGAFATVYGKPRGTSVIKIGSMGDNYISYAKEVVKNKTPNPFLPKISKLTIVKTGNDCYRDDFYIVEMERLIPLYDYSKRMYKGNIDDLMSLFSDMLEEDVPARVAVKSRTMEIGLPGIFKVNLAIKPNVVKHLSHLVRIINRSVRSSDGSTDIHSGNVMLRSNGQLVMTDPIS